MLYYDMHIDKKSQFSIHLIFHPKKILVVLKAQFKKVYPLILKHEDQLY